MKSPWLRGCSTTPATRLESTKTSSEMPSRCSIRLQRPGHETLIRFSATLFDAYGGTMYRSVHGNGASAERSMFPLSGLRAATASRADTSGRNVGPRFQSFSATPPHTTTATSPSPNTILEGLTRPRIGYNHSPLQARNRSPANRDAASLAGLSRLALLSPSAHRSAGRRWFRHVAEVAQRDRLADQCVSLRG